MFHKLVFPTLCVLNWQLISSARGHLDGVGLVQFTSKVSLGTEGRVGNESLYNMAGHSGRHASGSYKNGTDNRHIGREAEHVQSYEVVGAMFNTSRGLSHSRHIWKYVTQKMYAPSLLDGGCLYLPSDRVWSSFYSYVEHPYPPLFAEMVANAFYPNCGNTSLSGLKMEFCSDGRISGSDGCFSATHLGTARLAANEIHLYETAGHVGLPGKWEKHVRNVNRNPRRRRRFGRMPQDNCSKSWKLPAVPGNKKLVIPTQFVVCSATYPDHPTFDREMFKEQAAWMNRGYAGRTPWEKMSFDTDPPPQVDMQMEFDLYNVSCKPTAFNDCYRIKFVFDPDCARYSFWDTWYASQHNEDPTGLFTVVFISNDQSGILGMSEFPTETLEGDKNLVTMVSTVGLRHFMFKNKDIIFDDSYDEGDTITHEAGHALGLYHTFEGGCALNGDQVADTKPEAWPTYTCDQERSCLSEDPVHNFMDYPPDACMDGFTEIQKRRSWCIFENYRPKLFAKSLREL